MRSLKKVIAIVVTVAMLAVMFAFQASATSACSMELEGSKYATKGEDYTVKVRLNDPQDEVGGVYGTITAIDATIKSVIINPELLEYNKTSEAGYNEEDAADTIINKVSDTQLDFVSVANLKEKNHETRVWLIITATVSGDNPVFSLDASFSDKKGTSLLSAAEAEDLKPGMSQSAISLVGDTTPDAEFGARIRKTQDVRQQALCIDAKFADTIPDDAVEYGMLFCPEQLLGEKPLEMDASNDNIKVAKASVTDKNMSNYNGYIQFNFTDEEKACTLAGVKIAVRAYYKVGDNYVYSDNSGANVNGGMFSKAIISMAADKVDKSTAPENVLEALKNLYDNNNKKTILEHLFPEQEN